MEARDLYAMEHYYVWNEGRRTESPEAQQSPLAVAVLSGSDWYIRTESSEELYDMASDPEQRTDLSSSSERAATLRSVAEVRASFIDATARVELIISDLGN